MEKTLKARIEKSSSKLLKVCGFSRLAAQVRVQQITAKDALEYLVKRPMLCGRYYEIIKAAHAALV